MFKFKTSKTQKGITLIALIITIVVLLILAAVAIASITNDGVLSYAENATTQYNQAVKNEQDTLQGYIDYLNNNHSGGSNGGAGSDEEGTGSGTVLAIANQIQTSNTKVVDEYGNQIVVPAGFKIRVDENEGTKGDEKSTATNVTQGIVIEDEDENQFVWVPVGTIYTNADKTESKTITLGRYAYDRDTGTNDYIQENGEYTPGENITAWGTECIEETVTNSGLSQYGNAIARNIEDFIASSNQNKGYYIGRFEAGKESDKLVCKAGQTVYANLTQPNASTACKNMYNEGADGYNANTFSSDLINSYAWDTAIIFIQTFGGENEYYKQNKSTYYRKTGANQDEYCNINDMSGNISEWSTETYDGSGGPCVSRGGWYNTSEDYPDGYTSIRYRYLTGAGGGYNSFRSILYVAL